MLHVAVLDPVHGEVVPECSLCRTCIGYYQSHDPAEHDHSRSVQDDLRRDAVVAVAGEIAERLIFGDGHTIDPAALAMDHEKALSRASAIHLWADSACFNGLLGAGWCSDCSDYLAALRQAVGRILEVPGVRPAISVVAARLEGSSRLTGDEIAHILQGQGLTPGSVSVNWLPEAPTSSAN